ncbi:MAG TPA: dCTP deaminase [Aggregatilineales bacterium]|nr:dCTP deaminase [Chloroflexota bacterium]HOA22722.1 dCTP deaminase [Aggregatilineales bacterium]HQA68543.1 dCTP deaminase [Aggregatilineales bacterium]
MGLKSDTWIEKMATECGMIEPFVSGQVREGVISYGVSSYGYDIRVSDEFKVFTNVHSTVVDPKNFDPNAYVDVKGDVCTIPPNSFVLARSVEYIRMPRNVTGIVLCKSTYIRAGVLIPTTVLEAGWEGIITLEISNVTPLPARIYANEGIAQVLFFEGDEECAVSYADRRGKYQGQQGLVLPRI